MGVQGIVVKSVEIALKTNRDASWVEIEIFFVPVRIRSAALPACFILARTAVIIC